jgi:ribosomal protein L35
MPKVKSKKILIKRFRVTKKGKVMRMQGFRRHLNAKKTAVRRRRLGKLIVTKSYHAKKIRKALGK